MFKKILLWIVSILMLAGATFYFMNASDNYDAKKYLIVAPAVEVGKYIDFVLPDQEGKSHSLAMDTKSLVLTFSKETSHKVKAFLDAAEGDFLFDNNAFYITDISAAPTIIRNAFILPGLKKAVYSVLLMYDPAMATKFHDDAHKDAIMVLKLEKKQIKEILFLQEPKKLEKLLYIDIDDF